jgi:hypothetical protein
MSKVQLQGNVSGTGVFTIASPNSNTDRTLTLPDASGTIGLSGAAITAAQMPAGSIIQVVQATKTDVWTTNSLGSQWNDIPGQGGSGTFQVQITPSSSSSRIFVVAYVPMSSTAGQVARSQLQRNGTPIFTGDAAGSRPLGLSQIYWANAAWGGQDSICIINLGGTFVDSPATTSTLTYKIVVGSDNTGGAGTARINTSVRDTNGAGADSRTASSIIVMEIKG